MYLSKSLQFHGFSLAIDTNEVLQESFHAQSSCFAPGFMGNCEMRFSQDFWGLRVGWDLMNLKQLYEALLLKEKH